MHGLYLRGRGLRRGALRRIRQVELLTVNNTARVRAKLRNPRVNTRVAEMDDMLTGGADLRNYFEVGESALQCIKDGLRSAGAAAPKRILDLPSGYGRVLRHLRAEWPHAQITAMELVPEAARFCADKFGATPVVSRQPVWTAIGAGEDFNLVWCGSLLTHFDEGDWRPTLEYLRDHLSTRGVLVFTTHGERSIDVLAGEPAAIAKIGRWVGDYGMGRRATEMAMQARASGFAFRHYADDGEPYGLSVSDPEWVQGMVGRVRGMEFVLHQPHGWFQHQDVWTFVRSA